ncbi:hypothetical protein [Saccharopolyspora antimicrobica]|uniref:hypothetical protein n=1 Tax=Saccharopolyspora antimicrobica TaxID=455193 RepID=UPI0011605447|nr:hypothetical protein [Saccharopolyspora antimicrobica]
MRMNSLMRSLCQTASEKEGARTLPEELRDLVERGWRIGPNGALLFAACYDDGAGWRSDWRAEEIAQHELEVNDIGIPCGDFPKERAPFLNGAVARSYAFSRAALGAARGLPASELLVAIISVGVDDDYLMHGATVKFATRRDGFPTAYDDLERFQYEAMAVIEGRVE